jgi:ankyrin repeat protein
MYCQFNKLSEVIISKYPDIGIRRQKTSGKLLIHSVAQLKSSKYSELSLLSILKKFPDTIKALDSNGNSPLHLALSVSNTEINIFTVKELLRRYPEGCEIKNSDGSLPLHLILRHKEINVELIDSILNIFPMGAIEIDINGYLPFHFAVSCPDPNLDVIKLLFSAFPDGIRKVTKTGYLPLHLLLLQRHPNMEALKFLNSKYEKAIQHISPGGQTTLHVAIDCTEPSVEILSFLLSNNPNAISIQDDEGYLPLHLALDRKSPAINVVEYLISKYPASATIATKEGLLPLHFVIGMNEMPSDSLVQTLLGVYPKGAIDIATDYVPTDAKADPYTWEGCWIEKKWSPLSRAIERHLNFTIDEMKKLLKNNNISKESCEQQPRDRKLSIRRRKVDSSYNSDSDSSDHTDNVAIRRRPSAKFRDNSPSRNQSVSSLFAGHSDYTRNTYKQNLQIRSDVSDEEVKETEESILLFHNSCTPSDIIDVSRTLTHKVAISVATRSSPLFGDSRGPRGKIEEPDRRSDRVGGPKASLGTSDVPPQAWAEDNSGNAGVPRGPAEKPLHGARETSKPRTAPSHGRKNRGPDDSQLVLSLYDSPGGTCPPAQSFLEEIDDDVREDCELNDITFAAEDTRTNHRSDRRQSIRSKNLIAHKRSSI